MSVYDEVEVDGRIGQVKTWGCDLKRYQKGDEVPPLHGVDSYDIAMRDGGYVHVQDLHIVGWTDEPQHSVVVDKWGEPFSANSRGLLNEGYLHHSSTFTRTTFTFSVLSEVPIPEEMSPDEIAGECEDGMYLMEATQSRTAEKLSPVEMAKALIAAGSDPTFFESLPELLVPPAGVDDSA